jgi:hypothetical protein
VRDMHDGVVGQPAQGAAKPNGRRHDAPGVQVHHWLRCRRSTGPGVPVKTIEPGARFSAGAPG